jgi:transcriptional regulator with XRE-family HTH domain
MEDRLLRLLDTEQLSSSKFADIIGVQRSSISHILSGRNKPSFDFLQKTLKAFPHLNADWLILGKGDMYEGENLIIPGSLFEQVNSKNEISEEIKEKNDGSDEDLSNSETNILKNEQSLVDTEQSPPPTSGSGAKVESNTLKNISRVIVIYDDKSFDSYNQA